MSNLGMIKGQKYQKMVIHPFNLHYYSHMLYLKIRLFWCITTPKPSEPSGHQQSQYPPTFFVFLVG